MVSRTTMTTHMTKHKSFISHVLFSYPHIGLAAVSPSQEHAILAFPGRQQGHIQVVDLNKINSTTSVLSPTSPNNAGKTMQSTTTNISIIAAHSGQLSCLAMNFDGTKCATASEKGTLIRIFDTATGQLLNELRRGMDRAEIYSIAFNKESTRICVSSDKGTIHIFNLDASVVASAERTPRGPTYGEVTPSHSSSLPGFTHSGNRGSSFRFMKDLLPKYFSSEWSFAHATIPSETRCVVAFGEQSNSIIGKAAFSFMIVVEEKIWLIFLWSCQLYVLMVLVTNFCSIQEKEENVREKAMSAFTPRSTTIDIPYERP